jgi:hypothetical protein
MGINLTGADTVIFLDSDWNPQIDLQVCHSLVWPVDSVLTPVPSRQLHELTGSVRPSR